jgi:tRNA A-37 threonylcarbamoyl transferase component Bud32
MNVKIPGYEMVRPIAEGGMASVYLAVQQSLGRHVALKLLRKFDTPAQARRFQNEGQIIASLNHHNIITIYDIGVCGDQHYISMEYLEGGDLEARIQSGMRPEAALDLLHVMGSCLEFLHNQGIIHRDIKPANILFHKDGTPILTDFGVARQLESDMSLTMEGSAVGSPYYLSPEQAECKPLDGRTDIYGLGIIFHEMLTGVKPYQGESQIETILAHLTEPVPSLPAAFACYQDLLERMVAKDPDARFRSAAEMLEYISILRESGVPSHAVARGFSLLPVLTRFGVPSRLRSLRLAAVKAIRGAYRRIRAGMPRVIQSRRMAIAAALVVVAAAGLLVRQPSPPPRQTQIGPVSGTWPVTAREVMDVSANVTAAAAIVTNSSDGAVSPGYRPGNGLASGDERHLLQQARKALDEYRLTTPPQDNALYYYRSVLDEHPDQEEALAGVASIAQTYASLAERELKRLHYPKARTYIDRGLAVDPDNTRLRELESDVSLRNATRRAIVRVKSLFQ